MIYRNRAVLFSWLPALSRSLLCKSHLADLFPNNKQTPLLLPERVCGSLVRKCVTSHTRSAGQVTASLRSHMGTVKGRSDWTFLTSSLSRYLFSSSLLRLEGKRLPSLTLSNSMAKAWSFLMSLEWKKPNNCIFQGQCNSRQLLMQITNTSWGYQWKNRWKCPLFLVQAGLGEAEWVCGRGETCEGGTTSNPKNGVRVCQTPEYQSLCAGGDGAPEAKQGSLAPEHDFSPSIQGGEQVKRWLGGGPSADTWTWSLVTLSKQLLLWPALSPVLGWAALAEPYSSQLLTSKRGLVQAWISWPRAQHWLWKTSWNNTESLYSSVKHDKETVEVKAEWL